MTEQTENLILEILKNIQAKLADHDRRFANIEDMMRKQRRDMAGILVVGKATAGTFAEDIAAVKKRIDALESHSH